MDQSIFLIPGVVNYQKRAQEMYVCDIILLISSTILWLDTSLFFQLKKLLYDCGFWMGGISTWILIATFCLLEKRGWKRKWENDNFNSFYLLLYDRQGQTNLFNVLPPSIPSSTHFWNEPKIGERDSIFFSSPLLFVFPLKIKEMTTFPPLFGHLSSQVGIT